MGVASCLISLEGRLLSVGKICVSAYIDRQHWEQRIPPPKYGNLTQPCSCHSPTPATPRVVLNPGSFLMTFKIDIPWTLRVNCNLIAQIHYMTRSWQQASFLPFMLMFLLLFAVNENQLTVERQPCLILEFRRKNTVTGIRFSHSSADKN